MQLIRSFSDEIDKDRAGTAIEIGVGTDNFYSLIYKEMGFDTIAIDPVAYGPFLKLAGEHGIIFDECCIYSTNGELTLYTSEHSDLNSLHNNWWGITGKKSKTVKAQDLQTFIKKHSIQKISFLKVDTEGSEYDILQQFRDLKPALLPAVLEFEYGGGGLKKEGSGGWQPAFFKKTLDTLELLKSLNYQDAILLDSVALEPVFFSFERDTDFENLFKPDFEYGNLIAFKEKIKNKEAIKSQILDAQNALLGVYINELKRENTELHRKLINLDYRKRIVNKLKRILKMNE